MAFRQRLSADHRSGLQAWISEAGIDPLDANDDDVIQATAHYTTERPVVFALPATGNGPEGMTLFPSALDEIVIA